MVSFTGLWLHHKGQGFFEGDDMTASTPELEETTLTRAYSEEFSIHLRKPEAVVRFNYLSDRFENKSEGIYCV